MVPSRRRGRRCGRGQSEAACARATGRHSCGGARNTMTPEDQVSVWDTCEGECRRKKVPQTLLHSQCSNPSLHLFSSSGLYKLNNVLHIRTRRWIILHTFTILTDINFFNHHHRLRLLVSSSLFSCLTRGSSATASSVTETLKTR